MKAMVLAAGVGSRLKPITDSIPKALIEVGGLPMLELVLMRLKAAGVREVVVNLFHHADKVAGFLAEKRGFGLRVELSRESELLDTGGGLKKASWFFDDGEPFFLHNVDVLSNLDLGAMLAAHRRSGALATLAVRQRESGRRLLFAADGRLCGRDSPSEGGIEWAKSPVPNAESLAFDGVHVLSPAVFPKITESGIFSINRPYLRLAGSGERIAAFRSDEYYWQDIGSAQKLESARARVKEKGLPI